MVTVYLAEDPKHHRKVALGWGGGGTAGKLHLEKQLSIKESVDLTTDFLGFSYGFRPGRSPHMALDALAEGIHTRKVNWVLDADIPGFFDTIDHGWLMRFVEHCIRDRRVLRHIKKWLHAGVLEDGKRNRHWLPLAQPTLTPRHLHRKEVVEHLPIRVVLGVALRTPDIEIELLQGGVHRARRRRLIL